MYRYLQRCDLINKLSPSFNMSGSYYAVNSGRNPGIYSNWSDCKSQVNGYSGAKYKKFDSLQAAKQFVNSGPASVAPSSGQRSNTSIHTSQTAKTAAVVPSIAAKPSDAFIKDSHGRLQVWTDGACKNNGRGATEARAGVGVWFNEHHPLNVSRPLHVTNGGVRPTNNNAEIQAARTAIRLAADNGFRAVCVNTDSQFVIDCATKWMPKWKQNGWRTTDGSSVKNRVELEKLSQDMERIGVSWNHVKGHSDSRENEAADRLAVAGAK